MSAVAGFLRSVARRVGMLAGWMILLCSFSVHAADGLDWLSTRQNSDDGSYGGELASLATPVQSTAEVLRAHQALGQTAAPGFASALGYLNLDAGTHTEFLARKIVVNAQQGYTVDPTWISQLLSRQNADGGFGDRPGYGSSVLDTAMALEALASTNQATSAQAVRAIGFLREHQQSNGGWADGANDASVYLTAASMRALLPYRTTYASVAGVLTGGQNFLLSRRGSDGLWGEEFLSALALLAVAPNLSDVSVVSSSVAALRALQLPNGSWINDSYTTALALQAIRAVESRTSGSGGSTSTPTEGAISGYVVRANSSEPLSGVTVTINELTGIQVATNGDGFFMFPGLPPGDYTVIATKAGYTSAGVAVGVDANEVTLAGTLVLEVVPDTGLLRGKVFDAATLEPLQSVQVSLTGTFSQSVLTNGAGEFDFGPMVPGSYTVRFAKTGFNTLTGTVTIVAGRVLSMQPGMTAAVPGGYVDDAPGTVVGQVVNGKTGQPLVGAVFNLGGGLSATTGADGSFRITSVPRGTYEGTVTASGYHAGTFSLVFTAGASGEIGTMSLFPVETTPAPTTLTLRGLVVNGVSGAPIAGATVTLTESGAGATTGTDGRFVLTGITLKNFSLSVSATGYLPHTYTIQVSAMGEAEVQLQLSPPPPDVPGATTSTLAGVVTDTVSGAPISGARVTVTGTALSATTDATGHYNLGGITSLSFSVQVSAVGYDSRISSVKLSAHGEYPFNPSLQPVPGDSFQIVSLSANQAETGANGKALFTAHIASLLPEPGSALVLGEIQDATGTTVATVSPYAEGTTIPQSQFTFAPGEPKVLTIPWNTLQFAAGTYRLVLRVVEVGTVTRLEPLGVVLAEESTYTKVIPTMGIDGAMGINPPLAQAGMSTPVSFSALVRNAGNTPLPAGAYTLTVVHPDTAAVLYSAEASTGTLAVGASTSVVFGSWVAATAGNLQVRVVPKTPGIAGELTSRLYVGDKASGTFTVDRHVVPEGTHTVRGKISVQGVDVTLAGSTDPLFTLVKEAVKRGADYTAPAAVSWNSSHQCLGCHIQAQSLLGLSSSFDKVTVDRTATQVLYNAVTSSQWTDGALQNSYPSQVKNQTIFGLWSLSAWPDAQNAFRTKAKAARFLLNNKYRSGDQTWWQRDYNQGWWNHEAIYAGLAVKGLVSVLKDIPKLESMPTDYSLTDVLPMGTATTPVEDMAMGPDGFLYMVRAGVIESMDLQTGTVTTVVSGLPSTIQGLIMGSDGTMYVTRDSSPTLITIKPDRTRVDVTVGGQTSRLRDGVIGPDGWLYLSDSLNNRILRRSQAGVVEVYVSGGLLDWPSELVFDADGNLLIANHEGYNILKVSKTDRTVSVMAGGFAYAPYRMVLAPDNTLYVTVITRPRVNEPFTSTEGVMRVRPGPDGNIVERVAEVSKARAIVATGGHIYVSNDSTYFLQKVVPGTMDAAAINQLRDDLLVEIPRVARYFIATHQETTTNNLVHAQRLIGLAEARRVVTDTALLAQIDAAIAYEDNLLRNRQRADGGWAQVQGNSSDALAAAMVGLALEYQNPSADDPRIRNAIQYLLNTQAVNGSWGGSPYTLSTTSFVMVFMPKALERLGGIDIDLHVELPASVQLSNPTLVPASTSSGSHYVWNLQGVTGEGRDVEFDLTLSNMALHEQRLVASQAYLEFSNSFLAEKVQLLLDIPEVSTADAMTLEIATNKSLYQANEQVEITSTVKNTGVTSASGQVLLEIRAPGSAASLATLPPQSVTDLGASLVQTLNASWNTAATLVGNYEVYAKLLDAQGRLVAEAVAPFTIGAPTVVASTLVTTDKPTYNAWDAVELTGRVRNDATNAHLANSRVELTVKTPFGDTLYFDTRNVNQLAPGGLMDLPFGLKLADAVSGQYQVTLVLKDALTRAVLSTSTTQFQVERSALQGVTGTVTVASSLVYKGEPNVCTDTTKTVSASTVTGLTLTHQLVDVGAGTVLDEVSQTVNLTPGGAGHVYVRNVVAHELVPGGYACVLKAELEGSTRTLAVAGFQVVQSPIGLYANLSPNGRGRVLVLLDPAHPEDGAADVDPHGPASAPLLSVQKAFLTQLLTEAGYSFTLTESAADFVTELRSGGYSTYVLLTEAETLDQQVQKELREAVFRGEGLVIAGDHDSRHSLVHGALGIEYANTVINVLGVKPTYAGAPENGEFGVLTDEVPLRINRLTAESLGTYVLDGGVSQPGLELDTLTLNSYGRGRAAFAGVDLLAIATRDGQTSLAAETLRTLLNRVRSPNLYMGPGAVVPVELLVANLGIAVSVTTTVTVPTGASVIDPGVGIASGQTVTFTFPLAVDEVKTVRLWVRLPEVAGPMTLEALVSGSHDGHTVSVAPVPTLTLFVPEVESLSDIRTQLDALVQDGHPDSVVLTDAIGSLDLAIAASPAQATTHVLAAADTLSGLTDSGVSQLRVSLGHWLRWAGLSAD
ncbi:carboxypeptidase regulatory-like domain-containing protein [Archangium lansingense]|uniref:Carboxypeptidase regulatory-like domain-containing protein n=1 Tax=Archangium lansingense TaxID=2995310 RepID=A0ABT4AAA5_9BACT|nr:carboxypeptidase regulatory-like domain-containing protein [Archangium lansinium]MCY1078598.1 carboxypeptidase regulatory-like domain-containing protein [Archangium lansinium]